jgi:hypothetical protein
LEAVRRSVLPESTLEIVRIAYKLTSTHFSTKAQKMKKLRPPPQTLKKYRQPHFTQRFQGVGGGCVVKVPPTPEMKKP